MSEELRECPHCGATRGLYTLDKYGGLCADYELIAQIFCDNCKSAFENERADNGKELIDAWNTRAERTCHMNIVKDGPLCSVWKFDCCGFEYVENKCDQWQTDLPRTWCPHCGAKVVEE